MKKRVFTLLLLLLLAVLLCACGAVTEEDVEKTEGYVSPTDIEEGQEPEQAVAPPPRINGVGVYKTRVGGLYCLSPGEPYEIIDHIDPAGLVFPGDPTADIPVFVNPYPYNEGGPVYSVTDRMLTDMEQGLSRFLELLYGEYDAAAYPFHYEESVLTAYIREKNREETYIDKSVCVEKDGLRINSHAGGLNLSLERGRADVARLLPDGDLRQSPLLKAALDYMAIDDPQVECRVRYNSLNGQPVEYEYYIYQKADDSNQETLNRLLNDICVFYYTESDNIFISFGKVEYPEVSAELPAVSLDQAIEMVQEIFPSVELADIKVRLGYQTRIRGKYVLPCWELYVPSGCWSSDGIRLYTPLWVPMVDPTALD